VLASSSLGGSGLSAKLLGDYLQTEDPETMLDLVRRGICLPLYFDGDCALDSAVVVLGDLSPQEEAEWFLRVRGQLNIPCGEFLLMGGGMEEDFEVALPNASAPDPDFVFFQKFKVPPGQYVVEVYAFLNSMSGAIIWEKLPNREALAAQWLAGGEKLPEWLEYLLEDKYYDPAQADLQDYLIRLTPLHQAVAPPSLLPEVNWFGQFEVRMPARFPKGISRSQLLAACVE
jgi:hypothetical protein